MQIQRRLRKITGNLLTVGDVISGLLLGSSRLVQHYRCSEGIWLSYVQGLVIRGTCDAFGKSLCTWAMVRRFGCQCRNCR
jgi:hypothetical protein